MSMRVHSYGVGKGDALDMRLHFFYWGANFRLETLKVDFQAALLRGSEKL